MGSRGEKGRLEARACRWHVSPGTALGCFKDFALETEPGGGQLHSVSWGALALDSHLPARHLVCGMTVACDYRCFHTPTWPRACSFIHSGVHPHAYTAQGPRQVDRLPQFSGLLSLPLPRYACCNGRGQEPWARQLLQGEAASLWGLAFHSATVPIIKVSQRFLRFGVFIHMSSEILQLIHMQMSKQLGRASDGGQRPCPATALYGPSWMALSVTQGNSSPVLRQAVRLTTL